MYNYYYISELQIPSNEQLLRLLLKVFFLHHFRCIFVLTAPTLFDSILHVCDRESAFLGTSLMIIRLFLFLLS